MKVGILRLTYCCSLCYCLCSNMTKQLFNYMNFPDWRITAYISTHLCFEIYLFHHLHCDYIWLPEISPSVTTNLPEFKCPTMDSSTSYNHGFLSQHQPTNITSCILPWRSHSRLIQIFACATQIKQITIFSSNCK